VSDLAKWEDLAVNVLGLQLASKDGDSRLALRMDEHQQRIVLERSAADDLTHAGWLFDTEEQLDRYVRGLAAAGVTASDCGAEVAGLRGVEKVYSCQDPNGFRHEFAFGPKFAPSTAPFKSKVMNGKFVAGRLGLGHILLVAKNYQESVAFFRKTMGLRLSDYIRGPLETPRGVINVDATFMHTATGRHHSLATAQIPMPKQLHHMMIEVEDMDDVGLAYDRCLAAGFPIAMGLGHHPNDHMFSFYVQTPSGCLIEYGCGGLVVDDAAWEVKTYSQLSDWGHANAH
jgi:2,3-dihydroxybiphenyl 1,2-dioxygenase